MNRGTILLVEDSPDDEILTLRAFKKSNILNPVTVVHDGVEAVDYLLGKDDRSQAYKNELPVIVLLDLKLPKVDGLDVLRRVRENERTHLLPVIILTSSNEENDILQGYTHGANSYVRKPVNIEEFVRAVGSLGVYWLAINEPPGK